MNIFEDLAQRSIRTPVLRHVAMGVGLYLLAAVHSYGLDTELDSAGQVAPISKPAADPWTGDAHPLNLSVLSTDILLNSQSKEWLIGTLDSNADVLIIRFPKLSEQAVAMNRLAAYLEKASAPRNRVLNDAELNAVIARAGDSPETFYLGHDYRMSDIAHFFNQAQQQQLILQAQEQRLLEILLDARYLKKMELYEAVADAKAVITVSRLTPDDRQLLNVAQNDQVLSAAILAHEISHGEFLTRTAYYQQSWRFWKVILTENERMKWKILLKEMDYDPENEGLLVNEMQALLMHTPDERVFSAVHLLISARELARQRLRFSFNGNSLLKK